MGAFYIKYDTNVALISSFDVDELWFKLDKKSMKPLGPYHLSAGKENFILSTALYELIIDQTMKLNAESNKVSINAT